MMPIIEFLHPTKNKIIVNIPDPSTLSQTEVLHFTVLIFFIRDCVTLPALHLLLQIFQNNHPDIYFDYLVKTGDIKQLECLNESYEDYKQISHFNTGENFLDSIKGVYSFHFTYANNIPTRIECMHQFLIDEINGKSPLHVLPKTLYATKELNKTQITEFWRSYLRNHPNIIAWNEEFKTHVYATRLLIYDQHLEFICRQLFEFILATQNTSLIPPYSRYHTKNSWLEPRGRGVLFFTDPAYSNQYCVLLKSDTQIRNHGLGGCAQLTGSSHLYKFGSTRAVKLYELLFVFDYTDGCVRIRDIKRVVSCSSVRQVNETQSKFSAVKSHLETRPEDFINWQPLCFSKTKLGKTQNNLLFYQNSQGKPVNILDVYNWKTAQKLYASLSFLISIKAQLFSGYWPSDIKLENMCMNHVKIPDFDFQLIELNIIDFTSLATTECLYKIHHDPHHIMCMPISANGYRRLLKRLHNRNSSTPSSETAHLTDIEFGYLIAELMYEIACNLFRIWNIDIFSRCYSKFLGYNSQFLSREQYGFLTTRHEFRYRFQKLLSHVIYNTGLNDGRGTGVPMAYCVSPNYGSHCWQQIGNEIKAFCWRPVGLNLGGTGFLEIEQHPVFGPMYMELFDPSNSKQLAENLLSHFRNTQSPFIGKRPKIIALSTV